MALIEPPSNEPLVMQKLAVGRLAERRIARRAEDQAVPGLVDGVRRHPDDLLVAHCRRAAEQPLPQSGLDQAPWFPRAGLEDSGRQLEILDRPPGPLECVLTTTPHAVTVTRSTRRRDGRS